MKILMVAPVFPPHVGGLEKCAYNIAVGLAKREHNVVVFTSNYPNSKKREFINDVEIHRLPFLIKIFGIPATNFFFKMLKHNCDLIHVHIPPIFGALSSILVSKIKHIPVVLTFHNDTFGKTFIMHLIEQFYKVVLKNFILKYANVITTPSRAYFLDLNHFGININKLVVIKNGVVEPNKIIGCENKTMLNSFFFGKKIILFVGALERRKGIHFLIESLRTIKEKIPEAKLLIVGNGSERDSLKSLTHSLGLTNDVIFKGHITDYDLNFLYEKSDLVVLPSIYESFGLVLVEAMSHGKPVVATRIKGVTELVTPAYNGLLVEPKSSIQLAEAIISVLSNEKLAVDLGKNGLSFAKKFGWPEIIIQYEKIYLNQFK